ncbi:hypothetical protein [Streptomyces sioyaensis]|uniref:hypothetical protein n=1 Tax=Streptomyces sioyaensis TaxID=67364 RepID=UPI0037902387
MLPASVVPAPPSGPALPGGLSPSRSLPLQLAAALLPLAVLAVALLPSSGAVERDPVLGHRPAVAASAR